MGALPERSLQRIQDRQISPALTQWSAFILATKPQLFDLEGYDSAVALWQSRYPQHNVPQHLIERLRKAIAKRSQYPKTVALLLPLSGSFSEQASSVRDGFLGAYYNSQRDDLPRVHILDTQGEEAGLTAAVDEALKLDVQMIVGPLLKSSIEQLAARRDIRIPVLALNRLDDRDMADKQLHAPLFQFGLMPEDEGVQAARMAIVRNQVNALLLLPDNALGQRLGKAFRNEFATFGGHLLTTEYYDPEAADYGSAVKSALNTRQSESRLSILQTVLRRRVGFDARRRQDVDVIYLVAQPRQARSIKPLLKFHDAGEVPVLANSTLYTGTENPRLNRDIDGVTFTIMPWDIQAEETPLRQQLAELWPRDAARFSSLFALGADAFKLIPHLGTMASNPQYHTGGYTGHLSADEQGRIHRELMWAEYKEGQVKIVENDLLDLIPIENTEPTEPNTLKLKEEQANNEMDQTQKPPKDSAR
ncbi:LppC [gamma proteobacterium HTCC5015]|nr:LppC [gamma proteobacterium HTCC5015]